ncbi:MAG: glycosyltransferase family 2 protein [Proteobacteria bacterium]|nr:glycosyltransferase family 2 protein [Pseudomonadota bacterium]
MTKLSVIVVTKNEAHNIKDCLRSVAFADEIIVFDSGSTDGTPDICRQFTDKVFITPDWPGDGPQKNRAILKASGEWILCLDADERVSQELAEEIQKSIILTPYSAFNIPYQSTYCGKAIRFGDWRGESHIRLFLRTQAKFTEDIVHCHLQIDGNVGELENIIIHHPFHHLGAMIHKMNDYSNQSAKALFAKGKKSSLTKALSRSLWSFLRGYILKLGFLDGREGFLLAVSNAQGTYYRYLKLMYLTEQGQH